MSSRGDDAPKVHQRLFRQSFPLIGWCEYYRLRAELSWRLACGNNDSAEFLLIVSRNSPSDTSERITQYGECNNKNILPLWKQRREKQANFVLRRSPAKRKVVFYVYYYLEEELTRYPSF